MPSLSGFGCLVAIPREKITDKITRRVLAGMMVWWMGAGTHIGAYSHGISDIFAPQREDFLAGGGLT